MAKNENQSKWWFQGNLSDADYAKVGEVWDKQDIYSKVSRKNWIVKIWIPRLIHFLVFVLTCSYIFFGYTVYHYLNKPAPVFLYEGVRGDLYCIRTKVKSGKSGLSLEQIKFCKDLEKK